MRKILLASLLLAFQTMVVAQSYQVDYKVKKGERPAIDLSKVSPDAYEKGKIRIKLTPDMDKSISADLMLSGSKGYVETGIQALDELNQKFGAQQYKPLLYNFYKASAKSAEYENRHRAWGFHLWFEIEFSSKADVKDAIKQYTELNEVEFAEPVYKKVLIANVPPEGKSETDATKWTPSDTRFNEQWHYHNTGQQGGTVDKDIDLPEAWEIEKGNSAVIVAIVDGAVQTNHPDLSGNIWSGVGYNFVDNSSTLDPQPHGTHVGGTIAAETNNSTGVSGIAGGTGSNDGVRLMSCQVFTDNNSGGFDQAMIYAADNGAAISQNSWGYTSVNVYEQSVLDAIDYFNANGGGTVMNGGITIFAAGNDDATGNWYPGCYSGVLGVAATNNKDVRSYYSNYGTWVDISAPGGEQSFANDPKGILSTVTGSSYEFYQGTSMACPHVSGVAALLLSNAARHNFKPTSSQLRDLLVNNVDNHYDVNSSYTGQLGSGRLNANLAMQALQSLYSGGTPPTTPTGLSSSGITSSSASLSWNAVSGATSYDVQIRPQGGTYSTYNVTTNSYTATGLTASTTYEWSVRAVNTYGTSAYAATQTFTTQAPQSGVALPYSQTFNTSTIPTGWTTQNVGSGITERWTVSNTNKAGGSAYEMKCTYQNLNPGTTRLITPAINTSGVSQVSLTFRHMLDAYSTGVTLKIQTSNDKTSWTNTSWSVAATSSNINATSVTINITTNLNSPTTYIAFVVDGNLYNIDYWYVDNVSIAAGTGATTPTVTTGSVSNITSSTATVAGNVTADGGATVTERGICYSTSQNPTIANSKVASGSGIGTFSANLTGLTANTTYYARAYATNAQGTSYGSQVSFTTSGTTITYCTSKGSNSTYEWVDLVQFAGINRTSGNDGGYKDMTSLQATVSPGTSYTIYFSAGFKSTSYTEYWAIWIDYNHNGIFDDTEKVASGSSSSSGTLSANITIPATATLGVTRMRVSMKYNSAQTACETFSYGEVEDYSVNITSGAPANTTDVPFAEELTNEGNDIYTLYPNPASSMITIKLIGIEGEVTARIYDMRGAVVKFQVLTDRINNMDINDLAPGVYMISIDDEKQPIAKQFIKQ